MINRRAAAWVWRMVAVLTVLFGATGVARATCPTNAPLSCTAGWCCPYGEGNRTDVCCNNNDISNGCTTNGQCSTTTTTTCTGNSIPTQDTCGESSCSCASSCGSNGDCASGCCVNGYCALACTCSGGTDVIYNCGTNHSSTSPPGGCAIGPGADPSIATFVVIGMFALALVRRRKHQS